jgi:hypothetical protein
MWQAVVLSCGSEKPALLGSLCNIASDPLLPVSAGTDNPKFPAMLATPGHLHMQRASVNVKLPFWSPCRCEAGCLLGSVCVGPLSFQKLFLQDLVGSVTGDVLPLWLPDLPFIVVQRCRCHRGQRLEIAGLIFRDIVSGVGSA